MAPAQQPGTPAFQGVRTDWAPPLWCCLLAIAIWALLGAAACALTFEISTIPAHLADGRSIPAVIELAEAVLAVVMLPVCAVMPVPLLVSGCLLLRRGRAALARTTAWTIAATTGLAVEAVFLVRAYGAITTPFYNLPQPSWHALGFAVGYTAAGIVMASTLAATASACRRTSSA